MNLKKSHIPFRLILKEVVGKLEVTSEVNTRFSGRRSPEVASWGELHVKAYLGDADSKQSHEALQKFLRPVADSFVNSRRAQQDPKQQREVKKSNPKTIMVC